MYMQPSFANKRARFYRSYVSNCLGLFPFGLQILQSYTSWEIGRESKTWAAETNWEYMTTKLSLVLSSFYLYPCYFVSKLVAVGFERFRIRYDSLGLNTIKGFKPCWSDIRLTWLLRNNRLVWNQSNGGHLCQTFLSLSLLSKIIFFTVQLHSQLKVNLAKCDIINVCTRRQNQFRRFSIHLELKSQQRIQTASLSEDFVQYSNKKPKSLLSVFLI